MTTIRPFQGGLEIPQCATSPVGPQHHIVEPKSPGGQRLLRKGDIAVEDHRPLACDIILEEDVTIKLRDGTIIYADIYRPNNKTTKRNVPAIIAAGPFGKDGGPNKRHFNGWPWRFGCPKIATSGLEKFEGPDPGYWCHHGYAVVHTDCRGTWKSTGDVLLPCEQEGLDNYDIIEWLAEQPWCNGRVTMAGNSYLSMTQWFTGQAQPPHLTCLAPWEGISDMYNDIVRRGGIPNPGFVDGMLTGDMASATGSKHDDVAAVCYKYPTWNEYWAAHRCRYQDIRCPMYVVSSWTNALHVSGTFRAWEKSTGCKEKWLRVHNTHEWPDLYDSRNVEDLRKFYDHYMKDVPNDWIYTPKVRLSILNPGGKDIVNRPEESFPLQRQQAFKLHLNPAADRGTLSQQPTPAAQRFQYDAVTSSYRFVFPVPHKMEFTGHASLRLWAEADGADDMDVFALIQKHRADTGEVLEAVMVDIARLAEDAEPLRQKLIDDHKADPSYCETYFDKGPMACLRASHRGLDLEQSTDLEPVHSHTKQELLKPGEIVALDLAFWPYGWIFSPGEELHLTISGSTPKEHLRPNDHRPGLINKGSHVFHTGAQYDSFLLLPYIA